jgi:16S rRNA (uracil1498-N3)-methyltransferase
LKVKTMSVPRFFVPHPDLPREGVQLPLSAAQARHLWVLRLPQGSALELLLPSGPWKADLSLTGKDSALARLVAPLRENREAPFPLEAYIPVTAQLSLLDDLIPPLVELGVTLIQPVAFKRSEFDADKTTARFERWQRIVQGACEQSHRSKVPELRPAMPFESLLAVTTPQRWVAYEVANGKTNPVLEEGPIAFVSGPEGGITDGEYGALTNAGWKSVTLGASILRAITCPVAMLGAIRFQRPW